MYRKSRVSVTCIMHIIISWIVILSTLLTTVLTAAAHTTAPYDPAPVTTERVPAAAPITAPDDPAPVTTERATTLPITPPEVPATVTSARAPAITAAPASLPAPVPYGPVNAPSAPQSNPIAQAAYSDVLGQNDAAYHIAPDERDRTADTPLNRAFTGNQSQMNAVNTNDPLTTTHWAERYPKVDTTAYLRSIDLYEDTLAVCRSEILFD